MRFFQIIFLCAFLLPLDVFSQDEASSDTVFNQVDHLDRKQGFWRKHYPTGIKAYEGFFKDDKPRGEFLRYHENGRLNARMNFTACGDTARTQLYNAQGRMIAEGKFYKTQKHGVWNYFARDGRVVFTEEFNQGKKHGTFITYYQTGEKYEEVRWRNDIKHGSTVQYYPDGRTKYIVFYNEGIEHGPVRTYFPDSALRLEGAHVNGLKDGPWKRYSEKGEMIRVIEYENGRAKNHDELVDQETRELEELIKNVGRIQEPSVEEFLQRRF